MSYRTLITLKDRHQRFDYVARAFDFADMQARVDQFVQTSVLVKNTGIPYPGVWIEECVKRGVFKARDVSRFSFSSVLGREQWIGTYADQHIEVDLWTGQVTAQSTVRPPAKLLSDAESYNAA